MGGGDYDLSSLQYAFSTIAQTIATGFALLTAVVMYRLQSITATFPVRARGLESNMDWVRHPDRRNHINHAYERGDWDRWLSIATEVGFPAGLDKKVLESERSRFEGLAEEMKTMAVIKQKTREALTWTASTIALSLVCIPFTNGAILCNKIRYGVAWVAVIAATTGAIVCLLRYRPLVLEVINPPGTFGNKGSD